MIQAPIDQAQCQHCGIFFSTATLQQFCCAGCEFVYGLINAQGLSDYYKLKEQNPPVCPLPVVSVKSNYAYCDDPVFLKDLSPDGIKLRFYIEGLNCTACLWLLEKLPSFCSDAEDARIDMSSSTIEVWRKPRGSFAEIARTLNRFGYRPHPLGESETSIKHQARERRQDLMRIGTAGALTGNIMILAVSLYAGAVGEVAIPFRWLSAGLSFPVLTYCAWPFYQSAFSALRMKHLNIDVPIVLAILAGVITSFWGLFAGKEIIFFDSLSMLVFLLLSSRFVLKTIQNNQMRSTHLENELLLSSVHKLNHDGTSRTVSSLSLAVGDRIKIEIDRSIPVDGRVVEGRGSISTAVLTGESLAQKIKVGDDVEAGSVALSGDWILEVKNLPGDTRLAKILRDTEKASQEKSNFVKSADRVAGWFVSLVLLSALLTLVYFANVDIEEGITRALALLIVTCPCVFGIAIPLSMSIALRNAAKKGIIIKSGDGLERLWGCKTLVFDKTGTLTKGNMEVLNDEHDETADLSYAYGLEQNQTHPVARCLVEHFRRQGIKPEQFESVLQIQSGGVCGEKNGQNYTLKPVAMVCESPEKNNLQLDVGFFKNEKLLAKFRIGDKIRDEAPDLIRWVRRQNFRAHLVSGDRKSVVQSCANLIGLSESEIYPDSVPEKKAELIRSFEKGTVMIGDGVNDAMALATAEVGIAVCGSLDASLRAADIYLTRNHLILIPQLFDIARKTKNAILRNLFFSASFNLISGTLAVFGLMTPLWAAVLMPFSSIVILLSAVWTGNKIRKASVTL